jgi:flagellar motor switch protein FliM
MSEVLSQNEIDALLTAVGDGTVEAVPSPTVEQSVLEKSKQYQKYDLTSQDRLTHNKLVALNGIHERFANYFRMSLSQVLKKNVSVKILTTETVKYGDYLALIDRPVYLSIFENESLKANMIIVCRKGLGYSLVDAYYGGADRPFKQESAKESFTSIESEVIRKFAQTASKDLERAWSLIYSLPLKYQRSEGNPLFAGAVQPSEAISVVNLEVEIDYLKGQFDLLVQLHPLDAIQHLLSVNLTGQIPAEESGWKEHWLKELMEMEFEIRAVLGHTERTLKQIRQFKVGDVVVLGQDAVSPIGLTVQDVSKLKGMIGVFRGNNAVRLTKDLSHKQEESKDGQ